MEIKKFITGKVAYDKFGGQYFWINRKEGGTQMLAEMRGWGAIQNLFKNPDGTIDGDAAAEFQDELGDWIADAINAKLEVDTEQLKISSKPLLFGEAGRSEQLTAFAEWLEDNHSIKIHDMILQDYIRYGG